jgi:hypothetical protein
MLRCAGCDTIYFQHECLEFFDHGPYNEDDDDFPISDLADFKEIFFRLEEHGEYDCREETSYWPTPSTKLDRPDWWRKLPDQILINPLNSVYSALEHDLRVLAAIGMRVVFERASELIGVDPEKSFAKKLDQLNRDGRIGLDDKETLEVLTDAGSAAAHRGWEPDPQQLDILTSIMEHFVRRFILKEEAGKLKKDIPVRERQGRSGESEQPAQLIEFPSRGPSKTPSCRGDPSEAGGVPPLAVELGGCFPSQRFVPSTAPPRRLLHVAFGEIFLAIECDTR